MIAATCALLLALAAPIASAVPEVGDAGELPLTAQEPGPQGPLTAIAGTLSSTFDRDMYKVCPTGGGFSASTVDLAGFDTQLFLFNEQGLGVYANDDHRFADGSVVGQAELPSGHALTPTAPGVYYLAISAYNWDPQSAAGAIFGRGSGVVGPTGPGASLPVAGWPLPSDRTSGGAYTIALTGTRSCVDTTPPTIALDSPTEGAEYARGEQVLAQYSCADETDGSGLASCVGNVGNGLPIDTATLGTKTFTVTAEDNRGNRSTVTRTYRVVDRTPPTVRLDTPAEGAEYARGEHVPADYSCADEPGGSGLASCEGNVLDGAGIDTTTLGDKTFTVTAVDADGNRTSVTHSYRVVDRTAPTVDLRTPPPGGAAYARGEHVPADYSCADEADGSGLVSCDGNVLDGAGIDTATVGDKTFTVTAVDADGNRTSVTHGYTVVDRAPPVIDLRRPRDGATYALGRLVTADFGCTDEPGGSGLVSCEGDLPPGAPIDTSSLGEHTFTVRAEDAAGNVSTETATYRVEERFRFAFKGFLWPVVKRPRLNVVRAGWIVPMRFSLDGFHGWDVIADGFPRSREIACGSDVEVGGGEPTRSAARLGYKKRRDHYVYLWKTERGWARSCRQFILKLTDGSYHRADFRFLGRRHHGHHDH